MKAPVLTIDGPGGAGKGTVSCLLASRLGWHYLDSGAMYRALGLAASKAGVAFDDAAALAELAANMQLHFGSGEDAAVYLDNEEVSALIRSEKGGNLASLVAVHPQVRRALLARQRDYRQLPGLVADGRDMGTVVFPDATWKVFLTASAQERAQRRYKQLIAKGIDVKLSTLLQEIRERDERDINRSESPLKPAGDAVTIDTTGLSIDQVVRQIESLLV
ncbi:MAG: (d)CMP kinase [Pseudomonadales bacterium]|nr:(d)CMP kinase [Pseudomonadales bacterium]